MKRHAACVIISSMTQHYNRIEVTSLGNGEILGDCYVETGLFPHAVFSIWFSYDTGFVKSWKIKFNTL